MKQTFEAVLAALNEIAAVSGKLEKQALVGKHLKSNPDFKKCVVLMLDPFTRFYIKDIIPGKTEKTYGVQDAYNLFDQLSSRVLSGNAARSACGHLVDAGFPLDLMIRILNNDPKAGFGESTVNKCEKGLIADFPYMRCALPANAKFDTWDWKAGVISQEKADGMYATLDVNNGGLTISSRSGKQFPIESFANLEKVALALLANNTQTQGELLVCDKDGKILPREIGNGMLNKVAQGGDWVKGSYPVYHAWDQIPLSEAKAKSKYSVGYLARLNKLMEQLNRGDSPVTNTLRVIDTRIVHNRKDANEHFAQMLKEGKEGTIMSEPNAPWIDGTSKFKIKRKLTAPCELRIIGTRPGNGKNAKYFGSLICQSECGQLEVGVSGLKDSVRKEIWENFAKYDNTVITVDSNMIMEPSRDGKKWSLFLPRFADFRPDRNEADSLDRIKEQFEAALTDF